MSNNSIHSGGNMATFIDKLGVLGARDSKDPNIPLKIYIIEGPNFSSIPRLDGNNKEVELYELLYEAYSKGYIRNPTFNYSTDVSNVRVQATAKDITAKLESGVITFTVPINNRLEQINIIGTSSLLSDEGDEDDNKLKIKVNYTYDYQTKSDEKLFVDYTTLGLPTISAWDMQLVDLATDNTIDSTFNVTELSIQDTPRKIVLSKDNSVQINIQGLNLYSTWGISIRLPY